MQIREVFDRKRFVLLDGGMGTQLQTRGLQPGQKPELAALEMPDTLTAIHADYARAGADITPARSDRDARRRPQLVYLDRPVSRWRWPTSRYSLR